MADPAPRGGPVRTVAEGPAPGHEAPAAPETERYRLLDWERFRRSGASDAAARPEAAVIGAGAMGRVLLALDERMGRVVAIKEMHAQPGVERPPQGRFLREARVTGALEHPGIVPVHEIGERGDGAAFYTMRLVRGRSLAQALEEAADLRERLALLPHVVDLCHAVAFAHSQGVIHRDLKPENVMVGEFGETVVLDWGLASGLAAPEPEGAALSRASLAGATSPARTAGVMGTPAFMSPEQAWGRPGEVDEASDIWALGAILYQLLTGAPPVPADSAQAALEWLRDDRRQVEPVRARCEHAPRELASVAMACLRRDRAQRMASAHDMARELERWQAGERVVAHRYSAWELASHIVNRNRPLSAAVVVAATVGLAAVALSFSAHRARQEAEALSRQHAFEQLLLAREALEGQRPIEARARLRTSLEEHDSLLGRALWARLEATPLLLRRQVEAEVTGLAFSPDGGRLAVAHASPDLLLLDSWNGARTTLRGGDRDLYVVSWSPDGRALAAGSGGGEVVLWTDLGAEPTRLAGHSDIVSALAFDRSGLRLISGSFDGTARLWDLEQGRELAAFEGHEGPITAVAWDPWGGSFATASADQSVRTWDLTSGAQRAELKGHEGEVTGLAYLEGGGTLVSAGYDGTLRSWELSSGKLLDVRSDPSAQYTALAAAKGGQALAAADDRGRLHLWSPPTAEQPRSLDSGRSIVFAVALDPEGERMASGGIDRSVSLWNAASAGLATPSAGHEGVVSAVDVFPDGERIASAGWDGTVRLWELETGRQLSSWSAHDDTIESIQVAPDGATVATGGADHSVRIHDPHTGELLRLLTGHYGAVVALDYDPDGARLVSAGDAGMVYLWDLDSGARRTVLDVRGRTAVAFGPGGRRLAVAWSEGDLGRLRVQEVADDALVFEVTLEGVAWVDLDFTASGEQLRAITRDGRVQLWDLERGDAVAPLVLEGRGMAVAGAPDGGWVAGASTANEILIADLEGGRYLSLAGHREPVADLALVPGAELLVSAGYDGTVRLWDPVTGAPVWRGEPTADTGAVWPREGLQDRPELEPEVVLDGPQGTVAAGFVDGGVGLWDRASGARLFDASLHGPVVHLSIEGSALWARTELGSSGRFELAVLTQPRCALLGEVRARVPLCWDGAPGACAPDPGHPCAEAAD
jgi:WD40 repeat protein